jgi:hypothetical protein
LAFRILNTVLFFFYKKKFSFLNRMPSTSNFKKTKPASNFLSFFLIKKASLVKFASSVFKIKPFLYCNRVNFFFLRKSFFFTKTKYSRIRQICKNIVMLTLLLNIVFIFKSNEIYYNFNIENCFSLPILIFVTSLFFFLKKF